MSMLSTDHLSFLSKKGKAKLQAASTFEETLDVDDAFGELKSLTAKIAD